MSGLYFRGKITYAQQVRARVRHHARSGPDPGRAAVTSQVLIRFADADIDLENPGLPPAARTHRARAWPRQTGADAEFVLLGSVASEKYVQVLSGDFRLAARVSSTFVGRGDMSRGGLLLRAAAARQELEYVPVLGAVRRGSRPPSCLRSAAREPLLPAQFAYTRCATSNFRRWGVFNLVGLGGFVVQIGAIALLTRGFGWSSFAATAVALELAALLNFVGHSRWTWGDRQSAALEDWLSRVTGAIRSRRPPRWSRTSPSRPVSSTPARPPEVANTAAVLALRHSQLPHLRALRLPPDHQLVHFPLFTFHFFHFPVSIYTPRHADKTRSAQERRGRRCRRIARARSHAAAAAPQPRTKVNFDVPAGACDCHVHVFGDPKQYPFFAGRVYTPEIASVEELRQLLAALRLERVVIVQPSVYGTDNSCTLDGIRQLGNRARGVAVIDDKTSDADLDAMGEGRHSRNPAESCDRRHHRSRGRAAAFRYRRRAREEPQLAHPDQHAAVDHRGAQRAAARIARAARDRSFRWRDRGARRRPARLRRAGESGEVGKGVREDFRQRRLGVDARTISPTSRRSRRRWWPRTRSAFCGAPTGRIRARRPSPGRKPTDLAPHVQTDDGKVLNMLPVWVPDAATRKLILVDNPARLYGF